MKKISDWLFKKSNFIFVLIIFCFFLFNQSITIAIDKTLVNYIFKYAQYSTYPRDIVIIIFTIGIFLFYLPKRANYIPSENITKVFTLLLLFYLYYRYWNHQWYFTPFKIYNEIKYLDVIVFPLSGANLLLAFLNWLKIPSPDFDKTKNLLFDDSPITKNDDDLLGYKNYAKTIAEKIEGSNFEQSIAIGINGQWGTGKTSFIELILNNLKQNDKIFIRFNAWGSQNFEAIITDFFELLQENIRPYHSSLARKLIDYSNKLVKINDGVVSNSINLAVSALTGFDSIEKLNEEINDSLKAINKKLIISIDDLDRLEAREIAEVLKLVRNTANFHNTYFIVAYDRNYVINGIKELNAYNPYSYLEKIFQIEISLPPIDKLILKNRLIKLVLPHIKNEFHDEVKSGVFGTYFNPSLPVQTWINSMRDVTRLANSIVINYTKIQGEVYFKDFLELEILRIKYPAVYELIFKKTERFLDSSDISGRYTYKLKKVNKTNNTVQNIVFEYELEKELHENKHFNLISKKEIPSLIHFLKSVFHDSNVVFPNQNNSVLLSVIYPSCFHRYSHYCLLDDDLSEVEFSKARRANINEFKSKIDEWVNNKLQLKVRERFENITVFDDKDDFEKVIAAIFYLGNKKSVIDNYPSDIVGFNAENLKNKLFNYDNWIAKRFYNYDNGEKDFESFMFSLFKPGNYPYRFESSVLGNWLRYWFETKPMSKEQAVEIVCGYLKDFAEKEKKFSSILWELYRCCYYDDYEENESISPERGRTVVTKMPAEADKTIKDLAENHDFDSFIKNTAITYAPFSENKATLNISYINKLWGSIDAFEEIINKITNEKSNIIEEFKQFFLELKKANFQSIDITNDKLKRLKNE